MARKIGVLEAKQVGTQPRTYVKRSVAMLLIRRLLAEWLIENVTIRMVNAKGLKACDFIPAKPYIPFGLEPVIDARIGVIVKVPSLPNQVRFRALRSQFGQ